MSPLLDFFGALFGAAETPVRVTIGDIAQETRDADLLEANEGDVLAEALLPDGTVPFMWAAQDDSDPEDWASCALAVTAALYNPVTRTTLLFWAFDNPVPAEALTEIAAKFEIALDEPFPTPGVGDWLLAGYDADTFYSFEVFERAYGDPGPSDGEIYAAISQRATEAAEGVNLNDAAESLHADTAYAELTEPVEAAEVAPWDDEPEQTFGVYGDAVVKAPYSEADAQLQNPITVTVGAGSKSTHWKPTTMPLGAFVAMLSQHKVGAKDGMAWVLGDMVGGMRNIKAVKSLTAVGLDIDTGMSSEAIDAELKKLGCLAIRYTTHSHMRGQIEVPKDTIGRWLEKTRDGVGDLTDDETIRDFLHEFKKYEREIADTASFAGWEHTDKGIVAKIDHAPMPKNRVVLPLAKPFIIADEGQTQKDAETKWRKIPAALATQLGGIPLDKTGSDPNRLFYLPRHAKNAQFEIALFGGPCLDWNELELDDPYELLAGEMNQGRSKSTTEGGKELGRWFKKCGHGFQIADLIRDHAADRVRSDNNSKMEIECPFDEHHSNAGDPEDRACLVVNAGEGAGEFFTVSCRHESCQDRTMLDMVGKMVTDGWFDREELESEHYNALAPEDAPDPKAAMKIAKQDEARKEAETVNDGLNHESEEEEVRAAIKTILDADLGKIKEERELTKIRKQVGSSAAVWKQVVAGVRNPRGGKDDDGKKAKVRRDDHGRVIFPFQGEIDFHDAAGHCMETLIQASKKEPKFATLEDKPVMMSHTKTGRVCFTELSNRRLWAELNSRITFCRVVDDGGDGPRNSVPKEVADQIYETAYEQLPPAPEIIYTPMFNASGKMIVEPGWYKEDEILVPRLDIDVPEIPAMPTAEDVEAAVSLLLNDLLPDFPFLDTRMDGSESREPSQANALAMILTPFMRRMIDGCTPVFFISKPQPGTGGTLLGRIPMILFDGEESPSMIYTENPDEMAKGLLAGALAARSHMFFDDVKAFNNREILRATTSNQIGGRVLGATKTAEVANRFNWIATGNNPFITSEMERRICWVRMNAQMPDIQNRKYRHPDFNVWLKTNRAQIIGAILTLIQHWIVNTDCARFTERKQASFEDWAAKVGGVLQAAGVEGFLDNRREAMLDMDDAATMMFLRHWWKKTGQEPINPNDLFQEADNIGSDLIDGNAEDRRTKQKFIRFIQGIEGRAFDLDGKNVAVQRTMDQDKAPAFRLTMIEK